MFDVGANLGQYADLLRGRVGFRGPIISFEPIPELAAELRARAAKVDQWFIEETALDSAEGVRLFNVMASNQFSSLLDPYHRDVPDLSEANAVERRIEIQASLLSNHYQKYKAQLGFKRPFLKMDTQGNDSAVARGAGDLLRDFVGLQSELSIRKLYDGSADFVTVLDFYRSNGFELSAMVPNNAANFPSLIEVDCILYRSAHICG